MKEELKQMDGLLSGLSEELSRNKQEREEKLLEEKKVSNKVQQLQKDDQEAHKIVARMEQQYTWIEKEKQFFGKAGTDFDFEANSYSDNKGRLDGLNEEQKKLGKNINKKAMPMFEKAEQEYQELLTKRDIVLNDKRKIEQVIADLDEKKVETLRHAWAKVNKDFDAIFSTLLPHTNAKLEPPAGMQPNEGLEIKVAFNGTWKESLTELSGGQRSLLALSLVLALLKFKPAPMYILDEVDAALDLSHTQNIGHIIRNHFTSAQFIIVSLKDGMFNNANVLFRTQLLDGSSAVTRYAIRDGDAPPALDENGKPSRKRKAPPE
jgi:structural maintenance of chromosome 2